MYKYIKRTIILFLILLISVELDSQINPELSNKLQFIIDTTRTAQNLHGISAAVLIPSCPVWTGVSGISHGNVPIRPGMKFGIGSNTKSFISALILKLQELNVLSLEDSLHEWLPSYQYVNPNITIRQLLNHTSGIYNFIDHSLYEGAMYADTGRFWTPEEILATFMNGAYFNPGMGYHYSNTNYLLAGMIIKNAVDTTVSYKLRQFILTPLNLSSTFFPLEEAVPDTIAHGWRNGNIECSYPWTSWTSAAWSYGNMYSTAENMVRWYRALFNFQVISQSSLNQMLTTTLQSNYSYGLGISRVVINGRPKWQHDGFWRLGYRSATRIDSISGFCISVLINDAIGIDQPNPFPIINAMDNAIRTITPNCITGIHNIQTIAENFQLYQNYPNPFNPVTNIKFDLAKQSQVKLVIYNVLGKEVAVLVDEELHPGTYTVDWNASSYPSGVYYYILKAGDHLETKKMVLVM